MVLYYDPGSPSLDLRLQCLQGHLQPIFIGEFYIRVMSLISLHIISIGQRTQSLTLVLRVREVYRGLVRRANCLCGSCVATGLVAGLAEAVDLWGLDDNLVIPVLSALMLRGSIWLLSKVK